MAHDKLRRRIASEAARLLYGRQETQYHQARRRAVRRVTSGAVGRQRLPSNREIRSQLAALEHQFAPGGHHATLREMRLAALTWMRRLRQFRPRLHGAALSGDLGAQPAIRLQLFADDLVDTTQVLDAGGIHYELAADDDARRPARYPRLLVSERFAIEMTIYPQRLAASAFRNARTHEVVERAGVAELENFLAHEYPELPLDDRLLKPQPATDRFEVYEALLAPLEQVKQKGAQKHDPPLDALYHSLQVFELARDELPYDEEFLLAALLHDVGKAIDPHDHVGAALEALDGHITERVAWLIEHHMEAHALREGKLGARSRRRLEESEHFEELMLLHRCDREGRGAGVRVGDAQDALDYLRDLAETCGEA